MRHRLFAVAACSAAALSAAPLTAQVPTAGATRASDPRGLFVNGHVAGVQFKPDEDGSESEYGVGAGVQGGFNVTRYLGVFGAFDVASIGAEGGTLDDEELGVTIEIDDRARLTQFEVGGRLNVPIGQRVLPYLDVAWARRTVRQDFSLDDGTDANDGSLTLRGDAIVVGLGFQYFFRPTLAFDVGGRLSSGTFDELEAELGGESETSDEDIDADAQVGRLTAGLTWYPGGFGRR
jgi:opacity protein-like surface antigen